MLIRQIPLKRGVNVRAANISDNSEIPDALTQLGIPHPKTAIVLVGGAGGIGFMDKLPMKKAVAIVAQLAEKTQSVVIDGGTQAGIMTEIGKERKKHRYAFPLIGVVFDSLVMTEDPKSILDANHTHFFLIPGENWGTNRAGSQRSRPPLQEITNRSRYSSTVGIFQGRMLSIVCWQIVPHSSCAGRDAWQTRSRSQAISARWIFRGSQKKFWKC